MTTDAERVIADVLAERIRQTEEEGWTHQHDNEHEFGEMGVAAACYALISSPLLPAQQAAHKLWPWHGDWWKPKDRRRNLVRAAALIIAEIERADRQDKWDNTLIQRAR